jgi:cytochrome c biogenesis protein CcmG, thiol:disulfide interchange protein DsbE
MMDRWKLWLPLGLFAFIAGLSLYGLTAPKDEFVRSQLVGQKLPGFDLPAATEGVQGLSNKDFGDGKPRLLNFFGSWCAPCIEEAPQLETLAKAGAEIHGIALRDRPEDVADFLTRHGNPFVRIGSDVDMRVQVLLGSSGVPETYVIAGDGTITYQHIGDIRAEHVPMLLERLKEAQ